MYLLILTKPLTVHNYTVHAPHTLTSGQKQINENYIEIAKTVTICNTYSLSDFLLDLNFSYSRDQTKQL